MGSYTDSTRLSRHDRQGMEKVTEREGERERERERERAEKRGGGICLELIVF